jgi:membrane carboxypeptidase/penicillin-binding protein
MELAQAYRVLAYEGKKRSISAVIEITDNNGKVLYKRPEFDDEQVLDPDVAFIVSHILTDNIARQDAFGQYSQLVVPNKTVAVKTGTTNDKRDNWTAGYTNGVVTIVWVGNNDNSPMNQKIASGVTGASPIWNQIMRVALKSYPDGIVTKPESVTTEEIDSLTGGKVKDDTKKRAEYFIKDSQPADISSAYQKVKISKNQTNKRANDAEIASGQYEERDYIVLTESDPLSKDGKNRWQEGIDGWRYGQDQDIYKAPTEVSDFKPQPTNTPAPTATPTPTALPTIAPTATSISTPTPTATPAPAL